MMRKALAAILLLLSLKTFSQDQASLPYIDISKVAFCDTIIDKVVYSYGGKQFDPAAFDRLKFSRPKDKKLLVGPGKVSQKIVVRFNLANRSDSIVTVAFFPGQYFNDIDTYTMQSGSLQVASTALPHIPDSIGYRLFTLRAHDSVKLVTVISCVKTYDNSLRPRLINASYLPTYTLVLRYKQHGLDLMTYFFSGLLAMMIMFSIASYIEGGTTDFLYYSAYAALIASMLFTKTYLGQKINNTSFFFEAYLDFIMQSSGLIFYMIFMQRFLESRTRFPFIHKLYRLGIILLAFSMVSYSYLHFFSSNYTLEFWVETGTKILLLTMILFFVGYSIKRWHNRLLRIIVWGNIFLFIFAVISQAFIFFNWRFNVPSIFNAALFYYELALFLELVCFLIGLSYKNRMQIIGRTRETERLKLDNERKEFEKQMAVVTAQQEERNRISTDMHDELGSGMTAIRLMSEIAKNKMKENTPAEIERISQSADDVLNKMNAIIWSMNSKNDSLGNLVAYIRAYSTEYLEGTEVHCKVNIPDSIPEQELTGDKRRNIFLCVKETLNNMLKHSKANEVVIDITVNSMLGIKIHDNGVGIDLQKLRAFGNGLQNIDRRMKSIGGSFSIKNERGTTTILELPL